MKSSQFKRITRLVRLRFRCCITRKTYCFHKNLASCSSTCLTTLSNNIHGKMTLLPQQNVLFCQQTIIVVVTISLVTATTIIVVVSILIVSIGEIGTTTISDLLRLYEQLLERKISNFLRVFTEIIRT